MSDNRFVKALNEQIAYEFGASQQYAAVAVHYDAETLPRLGAHFYRQSLEERNHAMMMVQYLLDAGEDVVIPGVEAPRAVTGGSSSRPPLCSLSASRRSPPARARRGAPLFGWRRRRRSQSSARTSNLANGLASRPRCRARRARSA